MRIAISAPCKDYDERPNAMKTTKETKHTPETCTVPEGYSARVSCQTALDDYTVVLDAGTYPLRYLTVNFQPCAPEAAYWVCASIPGTRTHDGTRFGKKGDRVIYNMQTWPYALPDLFKDGR